MWQQSLKFEKVFLPIAALLFVVGLVLFAITESVLFLVPAFAILFLLLLLSDFKRAYWLLLFLVPLSIHIEVANNAFSLSAPAEPIMWVFYILGVALLVSNTSFLPSWFWRNSISLVVAAQLLWLVVAVFNSEVPLLSTKFLIAKSWYLVCFFIMPIWFVKEKKDFRIVYLCFLIPLLVFILIILTRHAFLGFRFYDVDAAVGNLFFKHFDYGAIVAIFLPFTIAAHFIYKAGNKKLGKYLLAIILLFTSAVILSYTRAAMGGVVFGVGVMVAIRLRLVNWVMPITYTLLLSIVLFFTTDNRYLKYHPQYEQTYMHHEFGDHLKATLAGKDMSSVERVYRWIAAARMAVERPVTGFGPHAFYFYYKPYTISSFRTYVSENDERTTTHNYFMYMMVEQGMPAMILYALLIMVVLAKVQKIYHRSEDPFYKWIVMAIAMSFSVCFVINLFSEMIETEKVGPIFYLSLALLVIIDRKTRRKEALNVANKISHS